MNADTRTDDPLVQPFSLTGDEFNLQDAKRAALCGLMSLTSDSLTEIDRLLRERGLTPGSRLRLCAIDLLSYCKELQRDTQQVDVVGRGSVCLSSPLTIELCGTGEEVVVDGASRVDTRLGWHGTVTKEDGKTIWNPDR